MTPWDTFFYEKIRQIFEQKKDIIDIGGGLRISDTKGNRYDPHRAWIKQYLNAVNYKILDPVPDYHPDIIGDIHRMPLGDASTDAIICIAVLEHIENPFKAFEEMHRVLKKGGYCFLYVPFLYYYHAQPGYYGDFWRYTEDSLKYLSRNFSSLEIQKVRGPLETWVHLSPLGRFTLLNTLARTTDILLKKQKSKQTSGYYVFLIK
ncbi:MAG: class I SAM-dependent methyltransferase [Patescibacteria group bacterium]